ncbi:Uncharacterised protein [Mycobacterium tuberculosis]|nr:Uncharacterised protein [Mycobacterium tuberculosis]
MPRPEPPAGGGPRPDAVPPDGPPQDAPLLDTGELDRWWDWALSPEAAGRARALVPDGAVIGELLDVLGAR